MAVSVWSKTHKGAPVEVSVAQEEGARDRGSIRVRYWKTESDPAQTPPHREETYKIYDIVTNADGSVTTCKASAPGSDPVVTIDMNGRQDDAPQSSPRITIAVAGTSFGLGDGRSTYEISAEARQSMQDFLTKTYSA